MNEETKICLCCRLPFPISEFGISKNRSDGLNPYSNACARNKVYAARERNRQMVKAQRGVAILSTAPSPGFIPRVPSCLELVNRAIRKGRQTRREIQLETGLSYDVIGDCLCELRFERGLVRSEQVNGERIWLVA